MRQPSCSVACDSPRVLCVRWRSRCTCVQDVLDALFPSVTSSSGDAALYSALSHAEELAGKWEARCDSVARQYDAASAKLPVLLEADTARCKGVLAKAQQYEKEIRTMLQGSEGDGCACCAPSRLRHARTPHRVLVAAAAEARLVTCVICRCLW